MSNPDQSPARSLFEVADSPVDLWLITESDGRKYTLAHQSLAEVMAKAGCIVQALCVAPTEAAAMAATVPAVAKFMGRRLTPEGTSEFWGVLLCDPKDDPAEGTLLHMAAQAPVADQPAEPSPAALVPVAGEMELIEKALKHVGIESLLNHGAASCVYSEGCCGVTQAHLLAYTREIALHCAVALAAPKGDSNG